jgi:hypothetical protein
MIRRTGGGRIAESGGREGGYGSGVRGHMFVWIKSHLLRLGCGCWAVRPEDKESSCASIAIAIGWRGDGGGWPRRDKRGGGSGVGAVEFGQTSLSLLAAPPLRNNDWLASCVTKIRLVRLLRYGNAIGLLMLRC